LEAAAIYGTNNRVEDTRKFLDRMMKETGRDFEGEDFIVEKDDCGTVVVSLTYEDRMSIFNVTFE
jgi:hypothetical protein